MSSKLIPPWLSDHFEFGSGFISSWLWIELALLSLCTMLLLKLFFPLFKGYRLGSKLNSLFGTDEHRHWFYGHTRKCGFSDEGIRNIAERTKTFPKIFCAWVGPFIPQVIVHHPETVIPALAHTAPKNDLAYRFVRPWIGDGLLTSHGKKWQRNRRLLTPAFHYNILRPYVKIFNKCSQVLLDNWQNQVGNPVDVSKAVRLMTLDTMLRCAMSSESDCQNIDGHHPYVQAVGQLTNLTIKRIQNPIYLIDWIFFMTSDGRRFKKALNVVHKQAETVISQRRAVLAQSQQSSNQSYEGSEKKVLDFLDVLLQAKDQDGKGLTDAEIREEVDTFLFEGHDTTASGISWLLYNLAKHPELQEKCRDEVLGVLKDEEDVRWEDLTNMNYCTMFIKETLRLYPPVPAVGRFLKTPLHLSKDLTIPAHCNMTIQIFATHHNHHVWESPEKFDPERFTLENISKRSSYAFIPFSAGPRNCIGQNFAMNEIKVVLCKVLRRYRLHLDHDTPPPKMKPQLVLGSESGIFVKFKNLKDER